MCTFSRLAYGALGVGVATLGGVALATAGLAFLIGTPRRIFNPRKSPARRGAACEDVTLTPRGGGPRLAAWSLPAPGAHRAIILTHGKDASRTAEFFGRFTEFAGRLQARGFQVLMLDMRGHGQSEAGGHTFGARERLDVLGAWDWLRAQGFELVGGRLLPDAAGPSAQLMYQDGNGQRVTVYLRKPERGTPAAFRYEKQGDLGLFYWVESGAGYALVCALPKEQLLALAQAIYNQGGGKAGP